MADNKVGTIIAVASLALTAAFALSKRASADEEPFLDLGGPWLVHPDATGHATLVIDYVTNLSGMALIHSKVWRVLDPPLATVLFNDTGQTEVTLTLPAADGFYMVELTIMAEDGTEVVSATTLIEVASGNPVPISIEILPSSGTMEEDDIRQLTATCHFSDGTADDCTNDAEWDTSNPAVAIITPAHELAGVGPGSVTITAEHLGFTDSAAWTITALPPPVNRAPTVSLSGPTVVQVGVPARFVATAQDDGLPHGHLGLTWSKGSGPGSVIFNPTEGVETEATFAVPGAHQVRITASDGQLNTIALREIAVTGEPAPVMVALQVDPPSLSVQEDGIQQLTATCFFNDGTSEDCTVDSDWVSANPTVASVTLHGGVVTGRQPGNAVIEARHQGFMDSCSVTVTTVPVTNLPDPPPGATRISGNHPNGFTVAAGQHAYIDGHVETRGSVIVYGKLWGREKWGSDLHFAGVNHSNFRGGPFNPSTDIGLWVEGAGELDYRGNYKRAWGYGLQNDPSWKASDEVVACPMAYAEIGANGFASYTPGSPLRTMPDLRGIPTLNLTRGVKMRGEPGHRAHYRNTSTKQGSPGSLDYCEISHFGVDVLGRYPVHHHMRMNASRGTVHKGLVVKHSGQHAFVTHMSDGVTYEDCIAYDIQADPYWYDPAEKHRDGDFSPQPEAITNDLHYVRCVAAWTKSTGLRHSGFLLARSERGNLVESCLSVGIGGGENAGGYHWSEGDSSSKLTGFWEFNNNTSLACNFWGIFTWQNSQEAPHTVASNGTFTAINCGRNTRMGGEVDGDGKVLRWGGIKHGAYATAYEYRNCHIYNLPGATGVDIYATSRISRNPRPDGYGEAFERFKIRGGENGIILDHHILTSDRPVLIKDFDMQGQSRRKIFVSERGAGGGTSGHCNWDLVNNGLDINDPMSNFENFSAGIAIPYTDKKGRFHPVGSIIRIQEGNQARRIHWTGAVTTIAPFYR